MYPVTNTYIQAMDKGIRDPVSMDMHLYNLNLDGQDAVECISQTDPEVCDAGQIGSLTADKPRKATLERDWIKADGSYTTASVSYWIGAGMSGDAPSDGWYSYPGAYDQLVLRTGGIPYTGVITLLLDGADIQVTAKAWPTTGGPDFVDMGAYTSHGGALEIPCGDLGYAPEELWLQITKLSAPHQRPKVLTVCVGAVTVIPSGDILSLQYTDSNDGLCLELPGKAIKCDVRRADWTELMYDETLDQTYPLWSTQAIVWVLYAGQRVPLGHYYAKPPTVIRGGMRLEMYDALGPLNDATHWWSRYSESGYPLYARLNEVMEIDRIILLDPEGEDGGPVRTLAQHLGITLDTASAANRSAVSVNPCPPVSAAQALQLYANLSGNVLRSKRTGHDLEVRGIPISTEPVRALAYKWLYDNPEVTHDGGITLSVTGRTLGTPETKDVQEGRVDTYTDAPSVVTHDNPSKDLTCTFGGDTLTAPNWYWYISYVGPLKDGDMTSDTATARVYPLPETYTRQRGAGGQLTAVSNPLLCGTDGFGMDSYQNRLYTELQHPILMTVNHRGYPEIDAGDIITVQTKRDGPYVKARVLENTLTYKSGALRGATKVRLLE